MAIERSLVVENGEDLYSNVHGVGTIILNERDEILVGTELQDKEMRHRKRGQLSIPMESLKLFERNDENALIRASLSEVLSGENIDVIRRGLREIGHEGPIALDEEGTQGALVVFRWIEDPNIMPFIAATPEEFSDLKWLDQGSLLEHGDVRRYVRPFLEFARNSGMLNRMSNVEIGALRGFNPGTYHRYRELFGDVS